MFTLGLFPSVRGLKVSRGLEGKIKKPSGLRARRQKASDLSASSGETLGMAGTVPNSKTAAFPSCPVGMCAETSGFLQVFKKY